MNRLNRQPEETLLDYQLRIFRNRENYGLTNQEMADLFNKETGHEYGESKYRKYLSPFSEGYDYAIKNNADTSEALAELEEAKKEFEIAKIQFQDQRREYRK